MEEETQRLTPWAALIGGTSKFFDDGLVRGVAGEVGPFIRVVLHVVEFFRAIFVADVSPFFCSDRNVPGIEHRDEFSLGFLCRVFEKGDKRVAAKIFGGRNIGEIDEGWVEIDEADRLIASGAGFGECFGLVFRRDDDERDAG